MKYIAVIASVMLLAACNPQAYEIQELRAQIDNLQSKLDHTYKPEFGEFMSSIQVHLSKLGFAGTNGNWKLANFEVCEIKESLDDKKIYCTDRPEAYAIGMIG